MNLVLKSKCIYDSVSEAPFAGYIEIENEKIRTVVRGDTDRYDDPSSYRVIDCGSRTVTAGLCDGHIHLFMGALHTATVDLYDTFT